MSRLKVRFLLGADACVSPRSLGRATQRGCIWAALTSAGLTGRLHGITRRISGTHAVLIVEEENPKAEVLVPNAKVILYVPYIDVPSVNTNSRGTRVWRRFIIHRAASQRQRDSTSKHTRKRSPVSTNCIKLQVQLPRHHRNKTKPNASLTGTFFYLSTCLRSVPRPVRIKRGTGDERRGGSEWASVSFSPVSRMNMKQNK